MKQTRKQLKLSNNFGGEFVHVSELKGGLPAWKAIGGPTEGVVESRTPASAGDYNVAARLQEQQETLRKESES